MKDNEVICLQIPGDTQYVCIARDAVDAVGEQISLPPEARMAVKLAVGEACNNAVKYAKGDNAGTCSISVACRVQLDALEIDVTNQGNGFHPDAPAAMPAAVALEEHGRGLALMQMMMDSVEFLSSMETPPCACVRTAHWPWHFEFPQPEGKIKRTPTGGCPFRSLTLAWTALGI